MLCSGPCSPLDLPLTAVVSGQPLWVAGVVPKRVLFRVPLDELAVVVGLVHQMAGGGGAAADDLVGDWLFAALDTGEEVTDVMATVVELDLGILQELGFSDFERTSQ